MLNKTRLLTVAARNLCIDKKTLSRRTSSLFLLNSNDSYPYHRRHYSSHFTYVPDTVSPSEGATVRMNMFQAVNNAMDIAMGSDPSAGKS